MTKLPLNVLAQPYSQRDLARFELLIFNANSPEAKIRRKSISALAVFVELHGKEKCDLMMAALSKFHDDKDKRPDA